MKCPSCGAESMVLSTRGDRRRRECLRGHRFSTMELVVSETFKHHRESVQTTAVRDKAIRADLRSHQALADAHGLAINTIRKIRRS